MALRVVAKRHPTSSRRIKTLKETLAGPVLAHCLRVKEEENRNKNDLV